MKNEKTLLYIDCIMRQPNISRTAQLCDTFIAEFSQYNKDYKLIHRKLLKEDITPLTIDDIIRKKSLIEKNQIDNSEFNLAKEFAKADHILIGTPFWELTYPALLKVYIENISIPGITFQYTDRGIKPLCTAKSLTYLTTAGGLLNENINLGAKNIKELCNTTFGIKQFYSAFADMLDVDGINIDSKINKAKEEVKQIVKNLKI